MFPKKFYLLTNKALYDSSINAYVTRYYYCGFCIKVVSATPFGHITFCRLISCRENPKDFTINIEVLPNTDEPAPVLAMSICRIPFLNSDLPTVEGKGLLYHKCISTTRKYSSYIFLYSLTNRELSFGKIVLEADNCLVNLELSVKSDRFRCHQKIYLPKSVKYTYRLFKDIFSQYTNKKALTDTATELTNYDITNLKGITPRDLYSNLEEDWVYLSDNIKSIIISYFKISKV